MGTLLEQWVAWVKWVMLVSWQETGRQEMTQRLADRRQAVAIEMCRETEALFNLIAAGRGRHAALGGRGGCGDDVLNRDLNRVKDAATK